MGQSDADRTGVKVVDNADASRYEASVDGQVAGYAEYERGDGTLSFTHTVVESEFEGHGVGSQLASDALEAARKEDVGVLPYCSFIRGYIEKHPEYRELVPADRRAEFDLREPA